MGLVISVAGIVHGASVASPGKRPEFKFFLQRLIECVAQRMANKDMLVAGLAIGPGPNIFPKPFFQIPNPFRKGLEQEIIAPF